jgi:hypothetical protein
VDGQLRNVNQRSDNAAFQKRVTTAYQTAKETVVRRTKPPPPPVDTIHPAFRGRGMIATWTTSAVWKPLAPYLDWIALLGRLPDSTMELADSMREAGVRVLVWEDENSNDGIAAVRQVGASAYIGQAESQTQLDQKLIVGRDLDAWGVPKALISNVTFLPPTGKSWPAGWLCIPECYENANAHATVANMNFEAVVNRGASRILPCFGLFTEGEQSPVWLDHYLGELTALPSVGINWCGYSLPTLNDRPTDIATLHSRGPVR